MFGSLRGKKPKAARVFMMWLLEGTATWVPYFARVHFYFVHQFAVPVKNANGTTSRPWSRSLQRADALCRRGGSGACSVTPLHIPLALCCMPLCPPSLTTPSPSCGASTPSAPAPSPLAHTPPSSRPSTGRATAACAHGRGVRDALLHVTDRGSAAVAVPPHSVRRQARWRLRERSSSAPCCLTPPPSTPT